MQQCTLGASWLESNFAEKNLGNSDGQRVKDKTAVCCWRIEGHQHTSQQIKGSDYSPSCNTLQAIPGIPSPTLIFPVDADR